MKRRVTTEAAELRTVRDRIWAAIRRLGEFDMLDLHREARVGDRQLQKYLRGLVAAGYVQRQKSFTLERDVGVHAPRIDERGREITTGKRVENMWRAVRILGAFTSTELLATASTEEVPVSPQHAKNFISLLRRKGCVDRLNGSPVRYRTNPVMCRGQRPPVEERAR